MRTKTAKDRFLLSSALGLIALVSLSAMPAAADEAAAKKWIDEEFQPSTLSKADQMKEMQWFINAAKPFAGMEINVVSETITTHEYEAKTMARAFTEITGIKVKHDLIQEGDVVEKIQTQMQSGRNIYDAWINDSDLIGTHFRYQQAVPLSDWMTGEGKDVTLPTLDVDDFIGKSFGTGPDGKLYQLPVQQFANLYWFRYDWFTNPDFKAALQGQVRLRARRAGELVGLRGHRRILHQRREGDRRRQGLWPHGLRQEGPVARLAVHRRVAVDGRQRRQGHPERQAGRRVGHPHGRLPPRRLVGRSRRRHQRSGGGLLDRQVRRLAEQVCPAECARHDVLRVGPDPGARRDRAADLLVHRLHRRHGEARSAGGERRRHAEVAHGPVAARARTGRTA